MQSLPSLLTLGDPFYKRIVREGHFEIGVLDTLPLLTALRTNPIGTVSSYPAAVYTLFHYATLVQNMYYLSDPTKSRRRQEWLPKQFTTFTGSIRFYDSLLSDFLGEHSKGFPFHTHDSASGARMNHGLFLVMDTLNNCIVSGTVFLVKVVRDRVSDKNSHMDIDNNSYGEGNGRYIFPIELGGIVTHPLYIGQEVDRLLLLSLLGSAEAIVKIAYGYQGGQGISLHLHVEANSFPFRDCMERLYTYAKSGLYRVTGHIKTLTSADTIIQEDLGGLEFQSQYLATNRLRKDIVSNGVAEVELGTWKKEYSVSWPLGPVYFKTAFTAHYDKGRLAEDVQRILRSLTRPMRIGPPTVYTGFISHSGYIATAGSNRLETFKVPLGVEVLIMNSPGYSVSINELQENWKANVKYFRNVPIDLLQTTFPPFKPVSLTSAHAFIEATDGGVFLKSMYPQAADLSVQIHCYKGGDSCPNLQLEATLGTQTTDFAAAGFGLYNLSPPEPYKHLELTSSLSELEDMGGYLFSKTSQYLEVLKKSGMKWPKKQYRFLVPRLDYLHSQHLLHAPRSIGARLNELCQLLATTFVGKTVRICIFSCGDIDTKVNQVVQGLAKLRKNHVIEIPHTEYGKYIGRVGEALYDIYNEDIRAHKLSAATPQTRPGVSSFRLRSKEATFPVRRGSWVSRGSRGSKGSKKTHRTYRSSRGSKGTDRTYRSSRGSKRTRRI